MVCSMAASSGSSVRACGVVEAGKTELVCGVEGVFGWRGVRCTWPVLMVVGDIVLPEEIDEAMPRTWSGSLIGDGDGDGDGGGSSGGGSSIGGGSGGGGSSVGGGSGGGGSGAGGSGGGSGVESGKVKPGLITPLPAL